MEKSLPVFFLFALLLCFQSTRAQNPPVFSHFYANPFQFNPSFIANNGYAEANSFYRKQWMGIENAPTTGALNIQAPVGRNVSIGFTAYSEKVILLSTTSALATFGYRVRFAHDHHVNFGLSAGVGFNSFNFAALEDTNDPALQSVQNNGFLNGQFGVNYQRKNFTIGFALPKLFQSHPNTPEKFNEIKFDEFRNKFGSVSYTIKMKDISIMPMAIYRALDANQDQWEGAVITTFKNLFWMGASYRTNYGLTGMIGVNIKGFLRLGYAYEHPTGNIGQVVNGSHEIYMGARLGKHNREEEIVAEEKHKAALAAKHEKDKEHAEAAAKAKELAKEQERIVAEKARSEKRDTAQQVAINVPPVVEQEQKVQPTENIEAIKKPSKVINGIVLPAYFVVLGVFKYKKNAAHEITVLEKNGLDHFVFFDEIKKAYYVYNFASTNREEALADLLRVRQQAKFADAWIYFKED